ncbi:monocarboxylate uptake permease MctP [Aestuariivirga litoralis]|uniref:monocarboxylate uptake permease MctP n=1 Tax=Aestuariivirga litoralis TaxID=2650924 RepID=UPI0018C6A5C3|nr:sodium:solute symporter family protein [Aestuariivirga litoralis]MBG1231978.1 sodium:solute symporter family protein [Aestuariivirga litoralis]
MNIVATTVFVLFFVLVTALGFWAARWKAGDLNKIDEWGLGGRQFGPWITWFLLGGDLYTAYTVIAVPAVVYAIGAYGFFAVPYTVLIYPLVFLIMPRLWNVSARHGYVTAADFTYGRFGNKWLELAVAITGIAATMPYIALQLVGMEKVIQALGFSGEGWVSHVPLTVAFVILALYTYSSGLRAPALIAFVKDIMIYVFVIAAIILIPYELGGFSAIFELAGKAFEAKVAAGAAMDPPQKIAAGLTLTQGQVVPFMTLAIGSAMALFMYPHSLTGVLSSKNPRTIRFNAMTLPAYSLVLGLIALLGLMGRAAGLELKNPQDVVPQLFLKMFPDWFVGFSFAAIAIGALVPAAVMSIGAANTFTRNVWRPFVNPNMSSKQESDLAKLMSLIVKLGALVIILFINTQFALDFQLLGGILMIQIFPAMVFGLYTRRIHGTPLLIGWLVGMALGIFLAAGAKAWVPTWMTPLGFAVYIGFFSVIVNAIIAVILSFVLPNSGTDQTKPADFEDGATMPPHRHEPEPVL